MTTAQDVIRQRHHRHFELRRVLAHRYFARALFAADLMLAVLLTWRFA